MTQPSAHLIRRRWVWPLCWTGIIAAGIALKSLQSPLYIFGANIDDELFLRQAKGFLQGHWSSSWSTTGIETMAKPVGYSMFLAAAHFFPWSPLVSVYLLYLVGVLLIAWSWRRISHSTLQATAVLAALVLDPIYFSTESQRIYREIFTNAVATVAIGLAFVIAAEVRARSESDRRVADRRRRRAHAFDPGAGSALRRCSPYALAVLVGLAVGVVAITKPTWQWVPVAVAAPLVYPLTLCIGRSGHRVSTLLKVALALLLVVISGFAVVEGTKLMNKRTYHVALVEDLSTGALARVWKSWASVEAGRPERYVPITKAMRLAVYKVSPTAAEMKPFLESPTDFWKNVDCHYTGICNESGNWFEWDLRDAANSTGKIHSVADLQTFFDRIADNIRDACVKGSLKCTSSPVLATGLPPLSQIPKATIASDTADGMWDMVRDQLAIGPPDGTRPSRDEYNLWASVVPDMSSLGTVAHGDSPMGLYSILRAIDGVYGIINVLLLAATGLGLGVWLIRRLSRRPRSDGTRNPEAAVLSGVFLLSAVIGMGMLAIFEAALRLGYSGPLYWSDFATPAELFLVFGAFASWPLLRSLRHASRGSTLRMAPTGTSGPKVEVTDGSYG
jgi:hypothetical protein